MFNEILGGINYFNINILIKLKEKNLGGIVVYSLIA